MRFNWLQPPFDNLKMRQAVLQVVNQSDFMAAMAGDPQNWRTCYSVYACLGSEETRGSDACYLYRFCLMMLGSTR
jgi:hypothetical protein